MTSAPPRRAEGTARAAFGALLAAAAIAACGGGGATPGAAPPTDAPDGGGSSKARLPWVYTALGAPLEPRENPSSPGKVTLGRLLFHDPILSGDSKTACVTCHSQYWGMGDGLPRAIGVGGTGPSGLGREGPTRTRRNAPTLWNAAFRTALFWDGRAQSLEEQVRVPISDAVELGSDSDALVARLAGIAEYVQRFESAFPGEAEAVTMDNVTRAIAAFVRTVVTTDAPYDRFGRGDDDALSPVEVQGMFSFAAWGCADCHRPPAFADDRYYAVIDVQDEADLGRFEVTAAESDRFAFRVASLRNVRETGPYFHDGHAASMRDAVREMVPASNRGSVTDDDLDALSDFIGKGLMDKAHLPERPDSVPSGLPVPVDGFTVSRQ